MKILLFLLSTLIGLTSLKAALPYQLPTTEADAVIDAIARSVVLTRDVTATPAGKVDLYIGGWVQVDTFKQMTLPKPASPEGILNTIREDKFRISLPGPEFGFKSEYFTKDSGGNELLTAVTSAKLIRSTNDTGNVSLPSWAKEVYLRLSENFTFDIDADWMKIDFIDANDQVTSEYISPTIVGKKKYFKIPSWYFNLVDYQKGLTTLYGQDENGRGTMHQYLNETGQLGWTYPLDIAPDPQIINHFQVSPLTVDTGLQAELYLPSWQSNINNPSFGYKAPDTQIASKGLTIYGGTTEGHVPLMVYVTEINPTGVISKYNFLYDKKIILFIYPKCSYMWRFGWGPDVIVNRTRG